MFSWRLNRGEFVVKCVVKVDTLPLAFGGRKIGQLCEVYFLGGLGGREAGFSTALLARTRGSFGRNDGFG